MKVLTFISTLSLKAGGPSRSVPMLVKGLSEIGVQVTLLTIREDDMNLHAVDNSRVKIIVIEPTNIKAQIRRVMSNTHYDIVQVQTIWTYSNHYVIQEARRQGIPYIITPRGMLEPWCLKKKRIKKRIALFFYQMNDLRRASCIYTTAESEAKHLRELGINVPISVIPNGIETDVYSCRTRIDEVKKQVLFLSRISRKKGIELLIDSWSVLHREYREWKLVIVGNGDADYIESLRKKVYSRNLSKTIMIKDPVFGAEKTKLYQESSLFCLPSFSENFGMVIAEAMSCGVPAVTTNNTPWQLLNGNVGTMGATVTKKTGWCIDLSVDNLTNALREAMSMDKNELYLLGQDASKIINENFNYQSVAVKTEQLYLWICSRGGKPSFVKE